MKEKPQALKYFSFYCLQLSLFASVEIYLRWIRQPSAAFDILLCSFALIGLLGAWAASQASKHVITINIISWIIVLNYFFKAGPAYTNNNPLNSIVLFTLTIAVQSTWLYTSLIKILIRADSHWWKTPPRVSSNLKAVVKTDDRSFMGVIQNISHQGLLINVSHRKDEPLFDVGGNLHIHLMLNKNLYVEFLAEVVRHHYNCPEPSINSASYGLKIVKIDKRSNKRIENFVNY